MSFLLKWKQGSLKIVLSFSNQKKNYQISFKLFEEMILNLMKIKYLWLFQAQHIIIQQKVEITNDNPILEQMRGSRLP